MQGIVRPVGPDGCAVPQCNICNCRNIMNASHTGSVDLSVCNWDLLRSVPFSSLHTARLCSALSSALCIVLCCRCLIYYEIRTWLLVFQMLLAQAIISNSPCCQKKEMKRYERKCNAPLPGTSSSTRTGNPGCLLPCPSSSAYSFCHFSAKFDLYRFYYICFFATPLQPLCPACRPACLPACFCCSVWL